MHCRVDPSRFIPDLKPEAGQYRATIVAAVGKHQLAEFECSCAFEVEGSAIARMILVNWQCLITPPGTSFFRWIRKWNANRKHLLSQPQHADRKWLMLRCLTVLMLQLKQKRRYPFDHDEKRLAPFKKHWHDIALQQQTQSGLQPTSDALHERTVVPSAQGLAQPVSQIPVLMYHSVTTSGDPALSRWWIHPDKFEAQLRYMKEQGYYSVTSATVAEVMDGSQRLYGKPMILTFDDGFQDFADVAWPLLKKYGFVAEMFVVTDFVGDKASWNADIGAHAPLMTWNEIRRLHDEGMRFGSHMATHRFATMLSRDELIEEAVRSRSALQYHLGADVISAAMPFGNWDQRLVYAMEWAGYRICYTVQHGKVTRGMNTLLLPRIEVEGGHDIDTFINRLKN